MDRNTITGLVVIFVILIGYSIWMTPSKEEREALQHKRDSLELIQQVQDSIANARMIEKRKQDSLKQAVQSVQDTSKVEAADTVNLKKLGVFSNAGTGTNQVFTIENELMKLTVAAEGGKIIQVQLKDFQTYDSLPLVPFDENKTKFGLTFFADNYLINTNNLYFQPENYQDGIYVTGKEKASLSMRLYVNGTDSTFNHGSYIEYVYTLTGDQYMMDFNINFVGMDPYIDRSTSYIDLSWSTDMLQLEKSVDRFNGPTIYYKFYEDEVEYLSETKDDEEELVNKLKWVSFKQRFFSSTLIAKDYFLNAKVHAYTKEEQNQQPHYLRSVETEISLPFEYSAKENIPMSFYFGPNKFKILRSYNLDLERQIPLGWSFFLFAWINRYAVLPVFNLLEGFGWNYGIIILVLTILLKIVLFPIAFKSYYSSAKMRVLKPEMEEISKKFPKKEDAMKKQQATMALYKQAGVNPMAGCIPMLLQFPILIAMFRFFPAAIELRQQPFLWANDLSTYDAFITWSGHIPIITSLLGNHLSLFTILMTISTIIYTKVNQDMMGGTQQQMPGMKTMAYLMPVMFLFWFNNYASGLSYYYFLANIITFGQVFIIRKSINEKKIRAQIELNKKRPVKKSKWQQRLEAAAKQRGYQPTKRK